MKLIKAFVRPERIDDILWRLAEAGAPGVTVSSVNGIGYGYYRHLAGLAPDDLSTTERVSRVEVVCNTEQADGLIEVLIEAARTGYRGDGIVFVKSVERAIKIRTGEEGPNAF